MKTFFHFCAHWFSHPYSVRIFILVRLDCSAVARVRSNHNVPGAPDL